MRQVHQLRMLASELRLRGHEVVATREPGGTSSASGCARCCSTRRSRLTRWRSCSSSPPTARSTSRPRPPALESDHIVLSDRYADATVAYQGAGRGFPEGLIADVVALATGGLRPDLTLIFDLAVDESRRRALKRARKGAAHDRLDLEDVAFHARVREAYLRIAAADPERVRVIDANGSVQDTQAAVMQLVMPFIEFKVQSSKFKE